MIKKILLVLMLVASTFMVAAPAYADQYVCKTKLDRNSVTFPNDEFVQFTVFYRYCVNTNVDKAAFVKPKRTLVSYNMPGAQMSCHPFYRKYDGIRFNWYFWRPFNGVNFNPKGKDIPCDESTMNSADQEYILSNVPRLYFGPGNGPNRQPRWKVNITLKMNAGGDEYKAHAQDFKP